MQVCVLILYLINQLNTLKRLKKYKQDTNSSILQEKDS
jgi:hypothetical protein